MNQSGYSSSDMLSMQADAIRRVREMQRRAQLTVSRQAAPDPPPGPRQEQNTPLPLHTPQEKQGNFLSGLMESLNLDNDRLLLLALILLLAHEGADTMLILALFYIMM